MPKTAHSVFRRLSIAAGVVALLAVLATGAAAAVTGLVAAGNGLFGAAGAGGSLLGAAGAGGGLLGAAGAGDGDCGLGGGAACCAVLLTGCVALDAVDVTFDTADDAVLVTPGSDCASATLALSHRAVHARGNATNRNAERTGIARVLQAAASYVPTCHSADTRGWLFCYIAGTVPRAVQNGSK